MTIKKPIRSSSVDIEEYFDLKEKLAMLDDEKNSLMNSLQYSNAETNTLMEKLAFQKQYTEYLENWKKEK
jgi:predicted nuclease with TOPRIM domain